LFLSIDVCVCIPGVGNEEKKKLYGLCDKYGFASAYLNEDRLASLQNYVIRLFSNANYIYKIDEDIVLGANFISGLEKGYNYVINNSRNKVGLVVPLINVNVFSYIPYLTTLNKIDDFDSKFGKAMYWSKDIQHNPDVARYLWETLEKNSFDQMNDIIYKKNKDSYIMCPQRYSIGAMLISREVWEKMGYFKVGKIGQLGFEEEELCKYLLDNAYFICCCTDTFVGHLGYGRQKETCKEYFFNNIEKFKGE